MILLKELIMNLAFFYNQICKIELPVQTTSKATDLGVLVTDNLKWSSHINHIHSVASHLSYIVLRAFSTKNIWTLLKI